MPNGRSFDPEIAEVILQAAYDGVVLYDGYVEVVHAQGELRARELRDEGASRDVVAQERRRWCGFTKSSITHWKRINAEFEDEFMRAEERAALERMPEVMELGDRAMEIAQDQKLDHWERRTQLQGLKMLMNSRMWEITARLALRRSYHSVAAPGEPPKLPAMPANPRFQLPAAQTGGGDDVN